MIKLHVFVYGHNTKKEEKVASYMVIMRMRSYSFKSTRDAGRGAFGELGREILWTRPQL